MFSIGFTKIITIFLFMFIVFLSYKTISHQTYNLEKLLSTNQRCNDTIKCLKPSLNKLEESREKHELFNHVKQYISKRKEKVKQFCDNNDYEKGKSYGVLYRLIIDRDNEITWCPICKAGSSVWMKIFASLGEEIDPRIKLPNPNIQISKLARRAFPLLGSKKALKALDTSTKFMIVRHPFERLLSTFRDKIEDITKDYYYKKYGRYIIKWYRHTESQEQIPTFEEFLLYIVSGNIVDEHWRPYFEECAPCYVEYDMILKIETFTDDQNYLVNYLGVDAIAHVMKVNHWDNTNPLGRTDELIKRRYFSQIPLKLLKSLYGIYENDFIMFDYSPEEYYAMAKLT